MKLADTYSKIFRVLLPTPLSIAIILTLIAFLGALALTIPQELSLGSYALKLGTSWANGLWSDGLIVFAFQMMLMLVLGHILALSRPFAMLIESITSYCTSASKAAFIVCLATVLVSFINWGLGLIFGAILARKVGEHASRNGLAINYALVGAAGYSGLMVWHGGISGSSLAKIVDPGHIRNMMEGISTPEAIAALPESIPMSETVFSGMNLTISALLVIILPAFLWMLGRKVKTQVPELEAKSLNKESETSTIGMEHFDRSMVIGIVLGLIFISLAIHQAAVHPKLSSLGFITPNWINFSLLGLCFCFHGRITNFLAALGEAIEGTAGILIQFPLYFGIMAIMKDSGLVVKMAHFFESISTNTTYPLLTFLSAGIINVFVPSGGGQWAVQGPIIVQTVLNKGLDLPKCILAMAYGDQLTNMLQPFWALPLLGITKLSAKQILPYTLLLMLVGVVIFVTGLLVF